LCDATNDAVEKPHSEQLTQLLAEFFQTCTIDIILIADMGSGKIEVMFNLMA